MGRAEILLCVCFIKLVLCQDEATVDEYVKAIQDFDAATSSYQLPVDSRNFLQGSPEKQECKDGGTYDFIIIGAGSAGCVLANRLTEVRKWRVLVLEAGDAENIVTDIPAQDRYTWISKFNWGYHTVPQKGVMQGYVNNSISIPRGKALGGSSVINSLIYARGNRDDYNRWSNEAPGWSYQEVLPYFKLSERTRMPNLEFFYHGYYGPWNMEYSRIFDKIGQAFLDGSRQMGRPTLDYNGRYQMGSSILQVNEEDGRRASLAKAFLQPASNRDNLFISPNTLVLKILVNPTTKTATGVRYINNGTQYCSNVTKEVILSAGSINSPQILKLSGIGPKDELQNFNITPIQDLPVGENLWDHLLIAFQYYTSNHTYPSNGNTTEEQTGILREHVKEYLNGKGPLTSSGAEQAIGYASPYTKNQMRPDIEYVLHTGRDIKADYEDYFKRLRYTNESYQNIGKKTEGVSAFHIHSILLHPKSRGTIKLKSSSPFDFPLIDPQYFTYQEDLLTFLAAAKDIIKITKTTPFQNIAANPFELIHPLCSNFTFNSDDFLTCMIKTMATTTHHFAGSCRMGPRWKNESVVDWTLKVHGVNGLRVVDCSVIPVTISGHTNAVATMIGEKGADIIKRYWWFR